MPKPYLLVTRLPQDENEKASRGGAAPSATGPAGGGSATSPTDKTTAASPSPSSDLSFYGSTTRYIIKLIYLPDMSKQMALNVSPGLFGTASLQPTLQDGWMLTSLQANVDTKTAETISSGASLLSALHAGGSGAMTPKLAMQV